MAYDKYTYNNDFTRENYNRMTFLVPKGKGAVVKGEAQKRGVSVSQLVVDALEKAYGLDLSKRSGE